MVIAQASVTVAHDLRFSSSLNFRTLVWTKRKAPSMKTACKNSKEKWVKCATKIACLTLSEPGFLGGSKNQGEGDHNVPPLAKPSYPSQNRLK